MKLLTGGLAFLMAAAFVHPAQAITPSGGWTLLNPSPEVKDHFFRIDVDPGETYPNAGYAPSSVYHAQMVPFANGKGGYLGLQRAGGQKRALVTIWDGSGAKGGVLTPEANCNEFGACTSIKGPYDWKVGHQYRFRVERSPRTRSDASGDWWMTTLADLTTGKIDVLGELKTPKWGGLARGNTSFLEYFWGPYECQTLRHSRATLGGIQGNYGQEQALLTSNGDSYAKPDVCGANYLLPGMTAKDYGSSSWDTNGTLTHLGNQYRGIHDWDKYSQNAKAGMFFVVNQNADLPYLYRARHDGKFWYFPAAGADNADWKSIGQGYPIINDLYFRNQRLYTWEERNASYAKVGDYFGYHNPYDGDLEYFKLLRKPAGYFPIDRSSNADWKYVGRHFRKSEPVAKPMTVHTWEASVSGKAGWLYVSPGNPAMYFRLKQDGRYSSLPTTAIDNTQWQFIGYHP